MTLTRATPGPASRTPAGRRRPTVGAPPGGAVAIAVFAFAALLALPLAGLVLRAPWSSVLAEAASPEVRSALVLSLVCASSATLLSVVLGLPLAWLLARGSFRGIRALRTFATLPLVLPPVVGGVALLLAFGRRGIAGQWLERATGVSLPFTTLGVILAETFVAMPFFVLTVEGALRSLDPGFEETAATLGARPRVLMLRVAMPMIAPSLASGAALTWARALGEFGATITFAGNVPGRTQTLPLAVYIALETRPDAAIALSLLLLAVSVAILAALGPRTMRGLAREAA